MNKQLIESTAKAFFGIIPYAGQSLSEIFFDYRSRVKQDRLNKFLVDFRNYLEESGMTEMPNELLKDEDFGDLFESVIRRVIQTNSKEKIQRFKSILGNFIIYHERNEYSETFLEIADKINETQICILQSHSLIKTDIRSALAEKEYLSNQMSELNIRLNTAKNRYDKGGAGEYHNLTSEILLLSHRLKEVKKTIQIDASRRDASFYNIDQGEFMFLKQDLYTKGLLLDLGINSIDSKPFEIMGITEFGESFLRFIVHGETDV